MGYAGVKDPQERADLIAYLKKATNDPKACEIERRVEQHPKVRRPARQPVLQ
jgi:hypothetical protein